MSSAGIVFRKEIREILRDRRTLIAIGLAALATPIVLFVISQVSTKTASATYTAGYSGSLPAGLDVLFNATGLKLVPVDDPATAAKHQVDIGLVFTGSRVDEYYDPTRQSAQLADVRFQTVLSKYDGAKIAASLQQHGVDPSVLDPLPVSVHPLSSPTVAAGNSFLSFFLPYILITMCLTGGLSAALDTSAGERERKTLESLLLTPAPRNQILVGKIVAVTVISLAAALAAIASMLIALTQIRFGGAGGAFPVQLSADAGVVMVWLAILLAASFSSVTVALGTLARNFRQGQAYATPLYFITIFPASIVLFIPDFNPNLAYYLIPILNAVLVLRDAIVHGAVNWGALSVTSISLVVTGALSFYAALKLFTREALLVRS
ncbi:MAG TPA: ABC transporter permease subunit [Candidatus Limnocylindrales bacterium]|nr:ABC transporter permease subunit [Candidatus Limnocylindrales bacterium]